MATQEGAAQLRRAVIASVVGTSIEWYDYFLYGSASALVFARLFFPRSNPLTGVLLAFATYFVGFAARPVGGAIFGHFGDRIGRKGTLIATLLTMGLATAVVGIIPGYATIGIWGAVLLTIMRILQGIGVGGEWGGSVLLAMEWGSNRRRGLVASWPQIGVPVGLILGNGALLAFSHWAGAGFYTWGWRVPFLLSLVLVAIGLYIRLGILETPTFVKIVQERRVERAPLTEVLRKNPGEIALSALLRMSEQAPFYIFTTFVLAFGVETLKFSTSFMLLAVVIAAIVSLVTIPLTGHFSDTIGRKRMYLIGVVMVGVFAFPYFALLQSGMAALVVLAVVLSLITHDTQYGTQAALIAESFTGRLRYSGASLGYQLASIIAGGPAPLIATALFAAFHSAVPIAIYIIGCAVVSLISVLVLPDRSHADHSAEYETPPPAAEPAIST